MIVKTFIILKIIIILMLTTSENKTGALWSQMLSKFGLLLLYAIIPDSYITNIILISNN